MTSQPCHPPPPPPKPPKNTHPETRGICKTLEKRCRLYHLYIKPDSITDFIDILNKFHENIKFTYEGEFNGKKPFLEVLLMRRLEN